MRKMEIKKEKKKKNHFNKGKKIKKREKHQRSTSRDGSKSCFFVRHLRPKEEPILSTREKRKVEKKTKRSTSQYGYFEAFSRLFMALVSGLFGCFLGGFEASSKPQHEKDGPNTGSHEGRANHKKEWPTTTPREGRANTHSG